MNKNLTLPLPLARSSKSAFDTTVSIVGVLAVVDSFISSTSTTPVTVTLPVCAHCPLSVISPVIPVFVNTELPITVNALSTCNPSLIVIGLEADLNSKLVLPVVVVIKLSSIKISVPLNSPDKE